MTRGAAAAKTAGWRSSAFFFLGVPLARVSQPLQVGRAKQLVFINRMYPEAVPHLDGGSQEPGCLLQAVTLVTKCLIAHNYF